MRSSEIRDSFIKFFENKKHRFVRSAPVVPIDDPTLLFTNAGMNQFKPIFLDEVKPQHSRTVNSQKCIRVSGKHNDLEEVGLDTFHHTFFEMLGNWSFGDYYKKESIEWAWELLTEVWGLDKNRLWVTVYKDDDEAYELWNSVTDIKSERVIRFGKKENFWEMGETGPCGPCSEIHYYIGDDLSKQVSDGVNNNDLYWELWNLVFIQNERMEDGSLVKLSQNHVDTGAGLERISCILQNKKSNYETDLFQPIIHKVEQLSGFKYSDNQVPFQVIADHIRMLCFSIADGALPSNEGRGYVLRRILRRAARFGRILNLDEPFLYKLVPSVVELMQTSYPELKEKDTHIELVIGTEESLFNKTLDRGISHLDKLIVSLEGKDISGKEAFKLYDTFGFPLDLTQLMAREKGLNVDEKGFLKEMSKQKSLARKSGNFSLKSKEIEWVNISDGSDSEFLGYESFNTDSLIRKYAIVEDKYFIVLDKTPFYAESGGQVSDRGSIKSDECDLSVVDVQKDNEFIIHICEGEASELNNKKVQCSINKEYRGHVKRNHTATHLLHAALKNILGNQVQQAGSLVHPEYLRFDLTYFEKINSEQIRDIENQVNAQILSNYNLNVEHKSFDDAKKDGAVALFGEKYGDNVRVVSAGDFSSELCGGTHVNRTGDIGLFKIIEESSLASGVRRIIAVTGMGALELFQNKDGLLNKIKFQMNCKEDEVYNRINQLFDEKKTLEKKIKNTKGFNAFDIDNWINNCSIILNHKIIIELVDIDNIDEIKRLGDELLSKLKSGIGVLFSKTSDKPSAVIILTKDLIDLGFNAGSFAKEIGSYMNGGGGGKPHIATAGGKDKDKVEMAIKKTSNMIMKKLNNMEEKNAV